MKPYKSTAILGFGMAVLATIAGLIRPLLYRPMVDYGLGLAKDAEPDYPTLLFYLSIMTGIMLFVAISGAIRQRFMAI